jgi:indolepyruvate ferredoxin oxidoreductase
VRKIIFTGVGGTGVTTVASILAMAAHVDGRAGSVVDMTGLAQKGGSVFSHVKIGETEETVVGGRVPAASADVLIACDMLVAASPEGLSLYAKDRTSRVRQQRLRPDGRLRHQPRRALRQQRHGPRIKGATKSFDACPAQHLAETQFGDAIFANMIMVGFAWQRGVIPLSSRAVYRAIKLNGVDYESNLAAFELGRRVAHDPASMGPRDADVPTPETMPLDELIAKRAADLVAYQNEAYAKRYLAKIEKVARPKRANGGGGEALTRAAAVNLYKLMAYKDEYEVARLYTDGRFAAELAGTFKGGKAKVWLAPPIIGAKNKDGTPRKMAFGGWMLDYAFPMMARMKGLRGGPLDVFGKTEERRMERGLIADYETTLDRLAGGLTPERLPLAARIAPIPQEIRGYGHVKDASVVKAKAEAATLWSQWEGCSFRSAGPGRPARCRRSWPFRGLGHQPGPGHRIAPQVVDQLQRIDVEGDGHGEAGPEGQPVDPALVGAAGAVHRPVEPGGDILLEHVELALGLVDHRQQGVLQGVVVLDAGDGGLQLGEAEMGGCPRASASRSGPRRRSCRECRRARSSAGRRAWCSGPRWSGGTSGR